MADAIINLSLNFEQYFPPPSRMITKLLLLKLASHMIPSHALKNQTGLEIVNQVKILFLLYFFRNLILIEFWAEGANKINTDKSYNWTFYPNLGYFLFIFELLSTFWLILSIPFKIVSVVRSFEIQLKNLSVLEFGANLDLNLCKSI